MSQLSMEISLSRRLFVLDFVTLYVSSILIIHKADGFKMVFLPNQSLDCVGRVYILSSFRISHRPERSGLSTLHLKHRTHQ